MCFGTPAARHLNSERSNVVMLILFSSRGRPAARKDITDAHSRMTVVSQAPFSPTFGLGFCDELLLERRRGSTYFSKRPNKTKFWCMWSQWMQPSPRAIAHMRWVRGQRKHQSTDDADVLVPLRRWVECLVHPSGVNSVLNKHARVGSCWFSRMWIFWFRTTMYVRC